MKKYIKDKGFSLIELIVAISILAILTGLLAPLFMRYIEKSREAVCRKNTDEMINIYRMESISDDTYKISDVINEYGSRCPSHGKYEDYTEKLGWPFVLCSIHDSEMAGKDGNTINTEKVYDDMFKFTNNDAEDIRKKLKEYYKSTDAGPWPSNDILRKYLLDSVYNGSWPPFDPEILKKNEINNPLYIQSYINIKDTTLKKTGNDNIILYAGKNKSDGNDGSKWAATLIYDPDEKTWYKAPDKKTYGIQDKNWSVVKKEIKEQGWKAIK